MANEFSKEERVSFEKILEGFNDALVMSKNVNSHQPESQMLERAGDTIWRPQPYIAQSFDGSDQTGNFSDSTQLSVPATVGYHKSSPFQLTAGQLRDQLQEGRLGDAAKQKLASDINVAVTNVASNEGTLVVDIASAATGFDDVALAESIMNEQGIPSYDRCMGLSTRDYNGMAGNLAERNTVQGVVQTAYEKALIGDVASFKAFKLDYAKRLTASTAATVTVNGANQFHVPKATTEAASGEKSNYDNRSQLINITVGSGAVKVGDAFNFTDTESVHHITKEPTGQLKTFRIKSIVSGNGGSGVVEISPAIISAQGGSDAEKQYQNVSATPADGAAITMLNIADSYVNPFWQKDAIEIMPATLAIPSGVGAGVMRAKTDQGIEVIMQKQFDINTQTIKYRMDTVFGVTNLAPEMSGIMIFNQS